MRQIFSADANITQTTFPSKLDWFTALRPNGTLSCGQRQQLIWSHDTFFSENTFITFGFVLMLLSVAVLWLTTLPLGVPGEWVWQRHTNLAEAADLFERYVPVIAAGLLFVAIAVLPAQRIASASRISLGLHYGLLMCASWCWLRRFNRQLRRFTERSSRTGFVRSRILRLLPRSSV